MKTKSKYIVAFTGLQNEVHSFTYNLDDAFFNEREYSPIHKANVDVELEFEKNERFFVLNFRYAGNVEVECDRCASDVAIPINNGASLLVKISDEEPEDLDDHEVMFIKTTDIEIDFSQYLYENIIVDIPLYKTCEDDVSGAKDCDPEVLSILENDEYEESGEEVTDPRWEKLKLLNLKNNGTSEE